MAYRKTILPSAEREIREIVSYLANVLASPRAAKSFLDELEQQANAVCEMPEMRPLSHLPELAAKGHRSCPVGSYLFLYKLVDHRVVIAHVFHQSRDYARLV